MNDYFVTLGVHVTADEAEQAQKELAEDLKAAGYFEQIDFVFLNLEDYGRCICHTRK